MNQASFNVITEPWIPVIRQDGSHDELGILPCLEQAHKLRELRDPSPIIEFGLYRLLVAFVLDALILADRRPEDHIDLKNLIKNRYFDSAMIEKYIAQCGDVFDMFHPERPFLQFAQANGDQKSIYDFYPVFPTGANVVHFAHQTSQQQIEKANGLARLLVMVSPFNVKVKTGQPRTIVGDPPIYVLPLGDSFYETIILNLPLPDQRFTRADEKNQGPIWRSLPYEGQSGTTPTQSFTWPCRLVKIILPDKNGYVKNIINTPGMKALSTWKDPSCAVFEGDNGKIRHFRFKKSLPLWLDAGPLSFCSRGTVRRDNNDWTFIGPEVIKNALAVKSDGDLPINFYAWRTDQAKVFEWTRSNWSVPSKLGRSPRLGNIVQRELDRAGEVANHLRTSIKELYPREGTGKKKALGTIADRCERAYWQRLEFSFHPLMNAFAALDPNAPDDPDLITKTAGIWRESIRTLAIAQFESALKDIDSDSDALERQVRARDRFQYKIKGVLYGDNRKDQ